MSLALFILGLVVILLVLAGYTSTAGWDAAKQHAKAFTLLLIVYTVIGGGFVFWGGPWILDRLIVRSPAQNLMATVQAGLARGTPIVETPAAAPPAGPTVIVITAVPPTPQPTPPTIAPPPPVPPTQSTNAVEAALACQFEYVTWSTRDSGGGVSNFQATMGGALVPAGYLAQLTGVTVDGTTTWALEILQFPDVPPLKISDTQASITPGANPNGQIVFIGTGNQCP